MKRGATYEEYFLLFENTPRRWRYVSFWFIFNPSIFKLKEQKYFLENCLPFSKFTADQ